MAYIFREEELPRLVSVTPGRERTFFVNKELAKTSDLLAGITREQPSAAAGSPEPSSGDRFCFILEGNGVVATEQGPHAVGPGTMIFAAAGETASKAMQATDSTLVYFEFQSPSSGDLSKSPDWKRVDSADRVRK